MYVRLEASRGTPIRPSFWLTICRDGHQQPYRPPIIPVSASECHSDTDDATNLSVATDVVQNALR